MNILKVYSKELKKQNGVFYTPKFLSVYLAEKVNDYLSWTINNDISELSILDPACGDSTLLREFIKVIQKRQNPLNRLEVIGVDKDKNAIQQSKVELSSINYKANISHSFFIADSLFPGKGKDTNSSWAFFKASTGHEMGFDVILSNPPWGADLSEYEPNILENNFVLASGQYDSYDLFAELIINNLSSAGIYGLIIPDSIFNQEHEKLRKILCNKTTLLMIARLGEKLFSDINRACTIIVGRSGEPAENHNVNCFRLSNGIRKKVLAGELIMKEAESKFTHSVPQSRFQNNENNLFDIDLRLEEQKILEKLSKSGKKLKEFVDNARGAEISKKGLIVQCNFCKKWMPKPKADLPQCNHCGVQLELYKSPSDKIIVSGKRPSELWKKIRVGENLDRYGFNSFFWIDATRNGINYKACDIYNEPKILVRKTGVGITACIDYEGSMTNQVVYILKAKQKTKIPLELCLALLNSRVTAYYLIKKYGENEWRTYPYLTQRTLKNIPFPFIDMNKENDKKLVMKVASMVRKVMQKKSDTTIPIKDDVYIERVVAKLFKLTKNDYKYIYETLASSEQLIPIKRLLKIQEKDLFNTNGI